MAHRVRSILSTVLFLRPNERFWNLPILVRDTSARKPPTFDNFVDRFCSALGVLFFGRLTVVSAAINPLVFTV